MSENLSGNHLSDEEYVDDEFERRVADIVQKRHRNRWRAMTALWIVSAVGWIYTYEANKHRTSDNRERIADVQASRVESCERTYNAIQAIFQPFFPHGKSATPQQLAQLDKFQTLIDKKTRECKVQVKLR